jgi:dTDP-glucose pyrophosphorylase
MTMAIILIAVMIYCFISLMLNHINTGKFEITLPRFSKPHEHKLFTKMHMNPSGHLEVSVHCFECFEKLDKTVFTINRDIWMDVGKRRSFYRAEETTSNNQKQQSNSQQPPKPDKNSWWVILGLNQNATKAQINTARRRLGAMYHPDNKKTGNTELMAKINNAADVGLKYAKA